MANSTQTHNNLNVHSDYIQDLIKVLNQILNLENLVKSYVDTLQKQSASKELNQTVDTDNKETEIKSINENDNLNQKDEELSQELEEIQRRLDNLENLVKSHEDTLQKQSVSKKLNQTVDTDSKETEMKSINENDNLNKKDGELSQELEEIQKRMNNLENLVKSHENTLQKQLVSKELNQIVDTDNKETEIKSINENDNLNQKDGELSQGHKKILEEIQRRLDDLDNLVKSLRDTLQKQSDSKELNQTMDTNNKQPYHNHKQHLQSHLDNIPAMLEEKKNASNQTEKETFQCNRNLKKHEGRWEYNNAKLQTLERPAAKYNTLTYEPPTYESIINSLKEKDQLKRRLKYGNFPKTKPKVASTASDKDSSGETSRSGLDLTVTGIKTSVEGPGRYAPAGTIIYPRWCRQLADGSVYFYDN